MHEFSIAVNIVDICEDNIKGQEFEKVSMIELDIGDISGVVIEALETAMKQAVKGTVFENTKIKINQIPAAGKCRQCGNEVKMNDFFAQCDNCGSFDLEVISGDELKVSSIVLD